MCKFDGSFANYNQFLLNQFCFYPIKRYIEQILPEDDMPVKDLPRLIQQNAPVSQGAQPVPLGEPVPMC